MDTGRHLKAKELAERLGVATSTIYRMSAARLIPSIPVGVKLSGRRFYEAAVREALAKQHAALREYHPPRDEREP